MPGDRKFLSTASSLVILAPCWSPPFSGRYIAIMLRRLIRPLSSLVINVARDRCLYRAAAVVIGDDPALNPVGSFRDLTPLLPHTAPEAPHIDPRRLRTMVDRAVMEYASAKTRRTPGQGAGLIQTAALVGHPPALARARLSAIRSGAFQSFLRRMSSAMLLGPVIAASACCRSSPD
jgi:hypothetical protein